MRHGYSLAEAPQCGSLNAVGVVCVHAAVVDKQTAAGVLATQGERTIDHIQFNERTPLRVGGLRTQGHAKNDVLDERRVNKRCVDEYLAVLNHER